MKTFIVLLRGVMPTGKKKVPMAELRLVLSKAGLEDVQTYIQSGNVMLSSSLSQSKIEQLVHDLIKKKIGADIAVLVRTAGQFRNIVKNHPFANDDTARIYFSILDSRPNLKQLEDFSTLDFSPEQVHIVNDVIYTLYATKYRDSKFTNNFFENKLNVKATTRNFNTMNKLVALIAKPPYSEK